jgi:dCMP deaminase
MADIIEKIYDQKSNFVIIGLTGRTGSGCSTVAELLMSKTFEDFSLNRPSSGIHVNNEDRKAKIIYNFMRNHWHPFEVIKASNIITFFVLQKKFDDLDKYITDNNIVVDNKDKIQKEFEDIQPNAKEIWNLLETKEYKNDADKIYRVYRFLFDKLNTYSSSLKSKLSSELSSKDFLITYQNWGDNIRYANEPLSKETDSDNVSPAALVEKINQIIKFLRHKSEYEANTESKKARITFICIDALRNPYEILFFRERFSAFYLVSINTDEKSRVDRLYKLGFDQNRIDRLDKKEYPDKGQLKQVFCTQNIQRCIELSDIHIVNKDCTSCSKDDLKQQLSWYISLILHPGLITPTPIERIMQTAYTAKLNSGCISRQVGAVITDEYFSIKAIGWNNTPEGHVPCVLRSFEDMCANYDQNAYSEYEIENNLFTNTCRSLLNNHYKSNLGNLNGRNFSYCFKDLQNYVDKAKNQVHTRSLHAEENAFLQLAKYGSTGIKGGKLFSTASPCELCSKKAYQLGIKEVYYIDPYPGISKKHILSSGSHPLELKLFKGAIGRAYFHLYNPILSYKDELSYVLKVNLKELDVNDK